MHILLLHMPVVPFHISYPLLPVIRLPFVAGREFVPCCNRQRRKARVQPLPQQQSGEKRRQVMKCIFFPCR
jgi:hypothetical protein